MMSNNTQSFKEKLVSDELKAATALLSLLKTEHDMLSAPKTAATVIVDLATQKEEQLSTLECASQNRMTQLPSSDPALLLEPLKSSWMELKQLAQECQQQNQLNGMIINSNKNFVEQASAILQGKAPSSQLQYGSSGKTVAQNQTRTIAKA